MIIFMAIGELAHMILRLQRNCNPRRNLKHKANQFNRERLEIGKMVPLYMKYIAIIILTYILPNTSSNVVTLYILRFWRELWFL